MHTAANPTLLLASGSANLISTITTALTDSGVRTSIACSAEAALHAMRGPTAFSAVLLDAKLPGMDPWSNCWPPSVQAATIDRFPVVLISEDVRPEWLDRLAEGVIDDLLPQSLAPSHWRIRLDVVLRTFRQARELESLRESAALHRETDPLTGLPNRSAVLSMLFRETDRVQRMHTSLCLMLVRNRRSRALECPPGRLGKAEELVLQVVARVRRLLRSYDLFGRVGRRRICPRPPRLQRRQRHFPGGAHSDGDFF